MAWLVDDDEEPDIEIVDSSPILSRRTLSPVYPLTEDESVEFVRPIAVPSPPRPRRPRGANDAVASSHSLGLPRTRIHDSGNFVYLDNGDQSLDQSIEFIESRSRPKSVGTIPYEPDLSIEFIGSRPVPSRYTNVVNPATPPTWHLPSSSPHNTGQDPRWIDMPSPAMPGRLPSSSLSDFNAPEPSFPIRPLGQPAKKRSVPIAALESPSFDMPPPSQRRLHRQRQSSPVRNEDRNRVSRHRLATRSNPLLDIAAMHSGDEVSEGSSHSDSDEESESDRLFLKDMSDTQVSPSYDQSMAYRQSLLSQAPMNSKVPIFENRPVRRGTFAGGAGMGSRRRPLVSSSPPPEDDELDEYVLGSFVVDDEAEISYMGNLSEDL